VQLDWTCPRDEFRVANVEGVTVFRASGFPRPIPGVPPERNLTGISFAVANVTGFVARMLETASDRSLAGVARDLQAFARDRPLTHVAPADSTPPSSSR